MADSLYIVMPAYNEVGNINKTVESWYPVLNGKSNDSRLIIADYGSTDGTHELLQQLCLHYPKLEILKTTNQYHGPKLIALYDYAIKQKIDYVFQTDSDNQTSPDEFEEFWQQRHLYDGIFGNRIIRGDGKSRAFVEKVVCLLLRLYFGVKIPDANAPFRLMKCNTLKKYLYKLPNDYNLPNIMMAAYYVYYNENYCFKEITFNSRTSGTNSINIPRIIKTGWQALWDFYALKRDMSKEK